RIARLIRSYLLEFESRFTRLSGRLSSILSGLPTQLKRPEIDRTLEFLTDGRLFTGCNLSLDTRIPADIVGNHLRRVEPMTAVLRSDRILERRRRARTKGGCMPRRSIDDCQESWHTVDDSEVDKRPWPGVR